MIRDARPEDLPAIHAIHNRAVATSLAIWTEQPETLADREQWFAEHLAAGLAVLVAEDDGAVVGYASLSPFRPKSGYRYTVENSVYVTDGHQGNGWGRALLTETVARARAAGFHTVVAGVESGNAASVRLHETAGFEEQGLLRQVGTKFGEWLDLRLLVLVLDDRPRPDGGR